jgi:DNA-binding GntR family transcriptional regulator
MAHTQVEMKKLLKSLPLRDRVYESLRKELFDGNFAPGQRITEQEIAVSLGVSRTPVREALSLFRKQVEDIFEIRRALEPLAARKAVKSVARQMFNICKI